MTVPFYRIFPQDVDEACKAEKIVSMLYKRIPVAKKFMVKLANNLFSIALAADPFLCFNISIGYQQIQSYIHLLADFKVTKQS